MKRGLLVRQCATSWLARLVVVAALAGHCLLVLDGAQRNYATIDEVGHLVAGLDHWETGSYRMYHVNPPLVRMVAVAPVLATSVDTSGIAAVDAPGVRSEWPSGKRFASDNAARYFEVLRLSRVAGVVWSVLGGLIVLCWARQLYGQWAGCLCLAMWCFEPNVIAHAQLLTPDVPAAVAGAAATYAFWHYLRKPSWGRTWLVGVLLGVAELTKFTMLVIYPVWLGLWLCWRVGRNTPGGARRSLAVEFGQGALIAFLSIVVINLGYGWQGTGRPLGDVSFISDTFVGEQRQPTNSGNRWQGTWLGRVPLPLPVEYLRGIDAQRHDFEQLGKVQPSYLAGQWREGGWWYYYVYALAVKVPLGIWAMALWGVVLRTRSVGFADQSRESKAPLNEPCRGGEGGTAGWRDELTLWAPGLAVLILVSSQMGFNHHLRYILPMFPFVIVATGKVARYLRPQTWKRGTLVVGLLAWAVGSSLAIHPHHLSYFNELAVGPDNGHKHLLNSNIDWGQDLLFLKQWLDKHPEARPLNLAYRNIVDPRIEGIEFALPPYGPDAAQRLDEQTLIGLGPQPGYHAISVNYLYGAADILAPNGKGRHVSLPRNAYVYFQRFEPIAKAGYSIFIYHISVTEANRVRRELGLRELAEVQGDE